MFGKTKISFPKTLHEFNNSISESTNPHNYINTKAVAFETQNGESVIAYYNPFCVAKDVIIPYSNSSTHKIFSPYFCSTFVFDLNGKKGPNKVGKDIWFMSTLYSDRLETVMFEPNRISREKTDSSYNAAATRRFCAEHNARMATVEEGIVSIYNVSFSGFLFSYMKDMLTNRTYAFSSADDAIFQYALTGVSTYCIYRDNK